MERQKGAGEKIIKKILCFSLTVITVIVLIAGATSCAKRPGSDDLASGYYGDDKVGEDEASDDLMDDAYLDFLVNSPEERRHARTQEEKRREEARARQRASPNIITRIVRTKPPKSVPKVKPKAPKPAKKAPRRVPRKRVPGPKPHRHPGGPD